MATRKGGEITKPTWLRCPVCTSAALYFRRKSRTHVCRSCGAVVTVSWRNRAVTLREGPE